MSLRSIKVNSGAARGKLPPYGWTSKNYVICVCFHCHATSSYHTTNTLQGRRANSHVDTQTIQPGLGISYSRPPIDPYLTSPPRYKILAAPLKVNVRSIAVCNQLHSYGNSHVIWDHTLLGLHSVSPGRGDIPALTPLTPAEAGTRFSDPGECQAELARYRYVTFTLVASQFATSIANGVRCHCATGA